MAATQQEMADRTREIMADTGLPWKAAWRQAKSEFDDSIDDLPKRRISTVSKVFIVLGGAVALTLLVAFVSGFSDDDPLIPQERVSELFEDSVATATALLGDHDVEASEGFEWHEDSWAGCEYARYARWRLTDYAAGDQALREIARLGADAGLRILAWDGTEDGGGWLDEQGTATWDDNSEPHYRYIGDQYGGPIPEHHLEAQILVTGVRPVPAFSFATFGVPTVDPPKGSDWLEVSVCRREKSD